MLEFTYGFAAFGDVLVHRHPAAIFDRIIDDVDDTAIVQFDGHDKGVAELDRGAQLVRVACGLEGKGASGDACVEQIADAAAAPDALGVDVVHRPVALVPHQEAILRIEHAQALAHVVERGVELHVLLAELAPHAPSRKGPHQADAEQRAGDGRERDRQRGQRHRIGADDFHRHEREAKAEHAGEGDHSPVVISTPELTCLRHGSTCGPPAAWPDSQRFSKTYRDRLWRRVNFNGLQSLIGN